MPQCLPLPSQANLEIGGSSRTFGLSAGPGLPVEFLRFLNGDRTVDLVSLHPWGSLNGGGILRMIVRIMDEGQVELDEAAFGALNAMYDELLIKIESGDEISIRRMLRILLDAVRDLAVPLPDDAFGPSELILPGVNASLDEIRRVASHFPSLAP
jgi:hypothetical protein